MLDSEIEAKTLSKENQRLRRRIFGLTILLYAIVTALAVFIVLAAVLAEMVAK